MASPGHNIFSNELCLACLTLNTDGKALWIQVIKVYAGMQTLEFVLYEMSWLDQDVAGDLLYLFPHIILVVFPLFLSDQVE